MKFLLVLTAFIISALPAFAGRRIGVIGAGPSGLSAAYFLKQKGYNNVTVLEKNGRVGGKCHTVVYKGRSYEMGAIMTGPSYTEVKKLSSEFNQKIIEFSKGSADAVELDPENNRLKSIPLERKAQYFLAAQEYKKLYKRYKLKISDEGFYNIDPELQIPFRTWARRYASNPAMMEEVLSHFFVSFGYGYMDQVPAAYVLKYFSPELLDSFLFGRIYMLENGYQKLWEAVARDLDVQLNFDMVSAKRIGNEWIVTSRAGKTYAFDDLILAMPLDSASWIVDIKNDLKTTLRKVQHQSYTSILVDIDMPTAGGGVITSNYQSSRNGSTVSWLYRWADKKVANFYRLGAQAKDKETVISEFKAEAKSRGWKINRIIEAIDWKYFPHFSSSALKDSPYKILEDSQSQNGLYLAGELMNFSTVEHSVAYSKDLVNRFFSGPNYYSKLTGPQKLQWLWRQVEASKYRKLPTYENFGDNSIEDLLGFLPSQILGAFTNNSDVLVRGRQKIIHKMGSTALVQFQPASNKYTAFKGIIRLSNAINPEQAVYPSFSLKIPLDLHVRSINLNIGKSFDGQMIRNNFMGEKDYNFFRHDPVYPFSNELPNVAHSAGGKLFKWIFEQAHPHPNYVPISDLSKVMNNNYQAPRRLVFVAPKEIRSLMSAHVNEDVRRVFERIPSGSVLFQVYESNGLSDKGTFIGELVTVTEFVASEFGDRRLYFRHEK
ncbi:MAG: FAD-dependent oxidoreductase [Pseudobdellovibrionaceae bacterium]